MKPSTKPKVTGAKRTAAPATTTATGAARSTGTASSKFIHS